MTNGVLAVVVVAIWAMLPAYVPNNVAVIAGGGTPIDGGRSWRGSRLLGDGKTWRGTFLGTAAGIALAIGLSGIEPTASASIGIDLPRFPISAGVTLAAGAMLGDILASFGKRRSGRQRGAPFPVVDQLDFVVAALGLTAIGAPTWFARVFLSPPTVVIAVVIVTPALHVLTNAGAYLLGLKDEPW